jgi:hypothetical protein
VVAQQDASLLIMNGPERSSGSARYKLRGALCSPGTTVIVPALAKKRAGQTETDVVVAVVGLVPVAVGGTEVVGIVVPRTPAQDTQRNWAVQAPGRTRDAPFLRSPETEEIRSSTVEAAMSRWIGSARVETLTKKIGPPSAGHLSWQPCIHGVSRR